MIFNITKEAASILDCEKLPNGQRVDTKNDFIFEKEVLGCSIYTKMFETVTEKVGKKNTIEKQVEKKGIKIGHYTNIYAPDSKPFTTAAFPDSPYTYCFTIDKNTRLPYYKKESLKSMKNVEDLLICDPRYIATIDQSYLSKLAKEEDIKAIDFIKNAVNKGVERILSIQVNQNSITDEEKQERLVYVQDIISKYEEFSQMYEATTGTTIKINNPENE